MVLPLWVMPLSAPVVSDVVVVMHHDSAVNTAVRTITENVPDVQVLEYGSLAYALTIHRALGRVVWVSHGSEAGILAGGQTISWYAFSGRIKLTPNYDIILACNSKSINQYISGSVKRQVFTFDGVIDATLGGFLVALLLSGSHKSLTHVIQRAIDLSTQSCKPDYLYWSAMEKAWFAIDAAIFIVSALSSSFAVWKATLSPEVTMNVFAGALQFLTVLLQLTVFLCGALSGSLSLITVATKILSILGTVIIAIIKGAPWWVQLLCSTEAVLTGPWRFVPLVLMIIGLVSLISNLYNDMADPDGIYGRICVGM